MPVCSITDPAYLKDQYRDGTNLDARASLHARFSVAPRDFHAWVFDHLELRDARILEIGCGTGWLIFPSMQFALENGAEQLAQCFSNVSRFDFEDALVVTEVEPLVAYAVSGFGKQLLGDGRENVLRRVVADRIARDGAIRITKAAGLFIAS